MKAFELRQLSDAELQKRIQEAEENLAHLRFQKVISQLENPMKIMLTRRDIARMRTILRERQIKGQVVTSGTDQADKKEEKV
ncbi:MAG TPA: 50S ribosomal protein L29 [Bacteroidota bacterium]|nr:50S ribosomal protein L29 [Bacteroidota bacterium]